MNTMEHLNSFFIERLMSVAGEIFEAVKDAVSEYQEELERTKQENHRLREILAGVSFSASSEIRAADVRHRHADGAPLEQDSNQRALNSDPSVLELKLELAAIKQEAEPHLPLTDASEKSGTDTWSSHADGVPLEQQNPSQGPQDPEPSLIQVKLELSALHEETGPSQHLSKDKQARDQEPTRPVSLEPLDSTVRRKDERLRGNSFVMIKLEPCDSQVPNSTTPQDPDDVHLDSESGVCPSPLYNHICSDLSSVAAPSQSHLPEKASSFALCDEPVRSAWLLKKRMSSCRNERPHRCHLCGKSYSKARVLRVHLKTHSSERPFQCEACGKFYKKKSHLKDHKRTHTGEKRYSCSACGMCFVWTNQVKVHIQNHHRGQLATVVKNPIR